MTESNRRQSMAPYGYMEIKLNRTSISMIGTSIAVEQMSIDKKILFWKLLIFVRSLNQQYENGHIESSREKHNA